MHELPRVPDSHGDHIDEKLFSDLYVRTSWVDAATAFQQIESVRHIANKQGHPRRRPPRPPTLTRALFFFLLSSSSFSGLLFWVVVVMQGKARGRRLAVYIRSVLQVHLYSLGCYLQKHAGKVIFVAILVLSSFCVGLKSATIHSKVQQLWIQGKKSPPSTF